MKEETIFTVNMPPIRVWSHVTDFQSYKKWHPNYEFETVSKSNDNFRVIYALYRNSYRINSEARINICDKPVSVSWTIYLGGLAAFLESYTLTSSTIGTEVRHSVEFQGAIMRIIAIPFRRGLRNNMLRQDNALIDFLNKERRTPPVRLNRQRRRNQFRQHIGINGNDG